jgi:hypothetical protein
MDGCRSRSEPAPWSPGAAPNVAAPLARPPWPYGTSPLLGDRHTIAITVRRTAIRHAACDPRRCPPARVSVSRTSAARSNCSCFIAPQPISSHQGARAGDTGGNDRRDEESAAPRELAQPTEDKNRTPVLVIQERTGGCRQSRVRACPIVSLRVQACPALTGAPAYCGEIDRLLTRRRPGVKPELQYGLQTDTMYSEKRVASSVRSRAGPLRRSCAVSGMKG